VAKRAHKLDDREAEARERCPWKNPRMLPLVACDTANAMAAPLNAAVWRLMAYRSVAIEIAIAAPAAPKSGTTENPESLVSERIIDPQASLPPERDRACTIARDRSRSTTDVRCRLGRGRGGATSRLGASAPSLRPLLIREGEHDAE
jgi:hypothetical protein